MPSNAAEIPAITAQRGASSWALHGPQRGALMHSSWSGVAAGSMTSGNGNRRQRWTKRREDDHLCGTPWGTIRSTATPRAGCASLCETIINDDQIPLGDEAHC